MDINKLLEVLEPARVRSWLSAAFSEAGISAFELLRDDNKVQTAAELAYMQIPRFPYRTIIKATIGEKGFTRLVFKIRDKMVETRSYDFSFIDSVFLKSSL